ncbi:MAG TPA: ferritin-like domain-containing protein [Candidatus Binatia bacterium]|jgi:bacterioferritin
MDKEKIINALNEALAQEHGCYVRYKTHAAVISGPYAEAVSNRLKEIAADESDHAEKLRDRINALGAVPTMETAKEELIDATNLKQILAVNLKEEAKAIDRYKSILKMIDRQEDVLLYEVIEDIIEDEQEHREELSRLQE